jgi:malto-oligosyltrehalose synthase/4-alpha-glucanotransferase
MLNPISTYRIQFHKEFTFKHLQDIIPYLEKLGIHSIYASPILQASPGSTHGYDTVNPNLINPEIGTLDELRNISKVLKEKNIKWIQDIVPNHMSFHPDNIWLMDVLEKGADSAYAGFFDINWSGNTEEPVMVPFLGGTVEETIEEGQVKLVEVDNQIKLQCNDSLWPVNDKVTSIDMPVKEALDLQYYRLCSWKETNHQINYRRFFTVNSLICLNIQHKETFDAYHELISQLLKEGVFQGLRVDHIDGLYDPETYLERLRELAGPETYIVIEKILEEGEELGLNWPVEGTTGYDYLAYVNNLFTSGKSKKELTRFYKKLTGDKAAVDQQILEKKAAVLQQNMQGELDNLYNYFISLDLASEEEIGSLKEGAFKEAIGQLLIHCPVYRFYGNQLPLPAVYKEELANLITEISGIKGLGKAAALLQKVLLEEPEKGEKDFNIRASAFYLRCMQFSGPLMAKGVEDTLMYTYNRFVGHNEVGDAPSAFGLKKKVIHNWMWKRQVEWPLALNASATHDTKRGEDARARLNIISELTEEWMKAVADWQKLNAAQTKSISSGDEYFIYQTLAGTYPMPGMPDDNYAQRLQDYLEKALREGKQKSSWEDPDAAYEQIIKDFAVSLLNQDSDFWKSFSAFHTKIAGFGIVNSLSQLLLKFTSPGVPDLYQGTELWDLSMVDPDNRRPVDYELRKQYLDNIQEGKSSLGELWTERYTGKIKLRLQQLLLEQRKANPEIFTAGTYIPLEVKGKYARHIYAFARKKENVWMLTVLPLFLLEMGVADDAAVLNIDWEDTKVVLPAGAPSDWENVLTGEKGKVMTLNAIFSDFPLALLKISTRNEERSAGILLSVTSLPSAYGIGDMGKEARQFVDFLVHSGQKYWQLLPLNPVSEDQSFSPYSAVSAIAGNTLLISPELLVEDGLLTEKMLRKYELPVTSAIDYKQVEESKRALLVKAYRNYKDLQLSKLTEPFAAFCNEEQSWLDDFALYMVLKEKHEGAAWYKWPQKYADRQVEALEEFIGSHEEEILFVKWQQFIFFKQWAALKHYAGLHGVQFYGDLPFYLSYDAAEVWSDRELFSVDSKGEITGIAGVPPDYFNADGQLWGMPVFNWDKLKSTGYTWWIERIRKNMQLYDLLRLDHFRAFADYWEVAAGEDTAVNGSWKTGPGAGFFDVLKKEFPELPFIAEDLGEIGADVYELRDQFGLAGMKVLQFGFGENMSGSEHVPHQFSSANFVVYTGTHDNNTSVGWFEEEASKLEKQNLSNYAGTQLTVKNVHTLLSKLAYASVAKMVILPMQDILGLDGKARMNKPASVDDNWGWRLKHLPAAKTAENLFRLAEFYGRV